MIPKKTYELQVNGLTVKAEYNEEDIRQIFLPLLETWGRLKQIKQRRILILMAAAPGTGKTTLSLFLEYLAKNDPDLEPLQAVGLDGFHFPQAYLNGHHTRRDGKRICLSDIKGAAETFDLNHLMEKIQELENKETVTWPVYDRKRHDVSEKELIVNEDIILLEGNWLLLDNSGWEELKQHSDYSICIRAEESLLRQRLIDRKISGGLSEESARAWYEKSDGINIRRVLEESQPADLELILTPDGQYEKLKTEEFCNEDKSSSTGRKE